MVRRMSSYVIDVQRCSIHDGPGIRTTVFLKGCPLSCKWCHNPESQSFQKELSYNSSLCISCGKCVEVCQTNVHQMLDHQHVVDFSKCNQCGTCINVCETKALRMVGNEMTPQEVFDIVKKDKVFYEQSEGGLTISGGEALCHGDFCLELLKLCKEMEIHTCIETSGYASMDTVKKLLPYVDLFLFDFKVSREEDAKTYIGGSLVRIHENFEYIYAKGKKIVLRCPIIPEVNDTNEHFNAIGEMTKKYPDVLGVELLPYHDFGVSKGNNIGKETMKFKFPTQEQKQEWLMYFQSHGYPKVKLS